MTRSSRWIRSRTTASGPTWRGGPAAGDRPRQSLDLDTEYGTVVYQAALLMLTYAGSNRDTLARAAGGGGGPRPPYAYSMSSARTHAKRENNRSRAHAQPVTGWSRPGLTAAIRATWARWAYRVRAVGVGADKGGFTLTVSERYQRRRRDRRAEIFHPDQKTAQYNQRQRPRTKSCCCVLRKERRA